jgi:hypothetical protein
VFLVAGTRGDQLGRNRGHHRWSATTDDIVDPAACVRIGRLPLLQHTRVLDLRRIDVGDGETLQLSRTVDDVDGTPIRKLRNRQLRHRGEGIFVIERPREDGGRVGEEGGLSPGSLRRLSLHALLIVQAGRRQRGGGKIGECLAGLTWCIPPNSL